MRLIDANLLLKEAYESLCENPHTGVMAQAMHTHEHKHFMCMIIHQPTIDPESLPIVQQLREALSKAVAEKEAAEALLAEYSGVDGCKTIKTCFGYPLDEVQRLVEADKAAKLQRAAKGDDLIESAQETAGKRLP